MREHLVKTENDIKVLMESFAFFHDSCIKEQKYYSGAYVSSDRAMYPFNSIREVSIIFQSQCAEIPVIELIFKNIFEFHLKPRNEDYDAIIYSPSLFIWDNKIYWSEYDDFSVDKSYMFDGTWISSESLAWKKINNGLGNKEDYRLFIE